MRVVVWLRGVVRRLVVTGVWVGVGRKEEVSKYSKQTIKNSPSLKLIKTPVLSYNAKTINEKKKENTVRTELMPWYYDLPQLILLFIRLNLLDFDRLLFSLT